MVHHERLVKRVVRQSPGDQALNVGGFLEILATHNKVYAPVVVINNRKFLVGGLNLCAIMVTSCIMMAEAAISRGN